MGHEKLSEGVWALVSSERLRVISEAGGEGNSIELTARYALVCACLYYYISKIGLNGSHIIVENGIYSSM